ncbi:TPA: SMEK domain-containing protein [Escherichia coli]|nr:SMEK domain-containing protein [Escherichia coli]
MKTNIINGSEVSRLSVAIHPTLLNQLYNYALMELNTIKHNYLAIDLGDTYKQLAVQITSDGSKAKWFQR